MVESHQAQVPPGASAGEDGRREALQPLSTPGKEQVWGTSEEGAAPEPTSGRAVREGKVKVGCQAASKKFPLKTKMWPQRRDSRGRRLFPSRNWIQTLLTGLSQSDVLGSGLCFPSPRVNASCPGTAACLGLPLGQLAFPSQTEAPSPPDTCAEVWKVVRSPVPRSHPTPHETGVLS